MAGLHLLKYEPVRQILAFFSSKSVTFKIMEQLSFTWGRPGQELAHLQTCFVMVVAGVVELTREDGPAECFIPKSTLLPGETRGLRVLQEALLLSLPAELYEGLHRQVLEECAREDIDFLSRVLGLELGSATLNRIIRKFRKEEVARGELLFHQGQPERHAYLL